MNSARKTELKYRASELADTFREDLHLTSLMPVNLRNVLYERGIQAFFTPMQDDSSGMAMKVNGPNSEPLLFMLVNTSKALGHQRFTCCHELYHLLFQKSFSFVRETTSVFSDKDEEEFTADWFASYLMLPKSGLEKLIPFEEKEKNAIRLATILKIENLYGCSRKTLLFRLKDEGYINSNYFDCLYVNVKKGALAFGYNVDNYNPTNKTEYIGDYNVKARELFDKGEISLAKYESLLEDIGIVNCEVGDGDGDV